MLRQDTHTDTQTDTHPHYKVALHQPSDSKALTWVLHSNTLRAERREEETEEKEENSRLFQQKVGFEFRHSSPVTSCLWLLTACSAMFVLPHQTNDNHTHTGGVKCQITNHHSFFAFFIYPSFKDERTTGPCALHDRERPTHRESF